MTEAKFSRVEKDGIAPDKFYSTTNLATYVQVDGRRQLAKDHRMDSAIVKGSDGNLTVRELYLLKKGDEVLLGTTEDGSEGIYVETLDDKVTGEDFAFMSSDISREKPTQYQDIADTIAKHREDGYIIWVLGPAVVHARAGKQMVWLIENGYVDALFGGNAIATHDIEYALYGTTLGMKDDRTQAEHGHRKHMDAINTINREGGIKNAVENKTLNRGVMYSCVKNEIDYVLAGSVRDDGPLTDTMTDMLEAQQAMRYHTKKTTCVVTVATALHSIATGNMLPCQYEKNGKLENVDVICVDQDEFVVNKLMDRGTHQAYGVIANAQDFMYRVVDNLSSSTEARGFYSFARTNFPSPTEERRWKIGIKK